MSWFSIGVALLAAFGIIAIGVMYLAKPRAAALSFGLPPPDGGPAVSWWLRLKGVRDVVSGLIVLVMLGWGEARPLGSVLLIAALIPLGDMSMILAARGSRARALGVHGVTAAVMIAGGLPLLW